MSHKPRSLGLADRLEVEAAVETAFEPLRTRRSNVGPTRVRAAVRWGRAEPAVPVGWAVAVRRISELGVAAGISAFVFAAALAAPPAPAVPVSEAAVVEGILDMPVQERPLPWLFFVADDDDDQKMVMDIKRERLLPVADEIAGNFGDADRRDAFELPFGAAPLLRLR